ncbi:MAG: nuclease-related domain-containing protein [Coriobacteriia bacterium]|nr:nuclease-related domain-containing protein [Coriobacteriia bacterium]
MEYRETRSLGDVGERRIRDAFHSEAPSLGFRMLDGVLLDIGDETAYFDHLVIDRHGILMVEAKSGDAEIRGTSASGTWMAKFPNGGLEKLLNPLRENERNRSVLSRVLQASGRRLGDDYIQSVVVFAGSDIRHLKLTEADKLRVVPIREVGDLMRARYDFTPNPGGLSAENIANLISTLKNADQSRIIDTRHKHADRVARELRPFPLNLLPTMPVFPTQRSREAAVTRNVFSGVDRYEGINTSTPPRRAFFTPSGFLTLVAVVAVLGWILAGGGAAVLETAVMSGSLQPLVALVWTPRQVMPVRVVAPLSPAVPVTPMVDAPDLQTALRRLHSASPTAWASLQEPDNPLVMCRDGLTKFTWVSLESESPGSVQARTVSITLDNQGGLIGVDAGQ